MNEQVWTTVYILASCGWLAMAGWMIIWMFTADDWKPPVVKADEPDTVSMSRSPGLCCVEYFSPVQRRVIIEWIERDPLSPPALRSFARQLAHAAPHEAVPIYWGQVRSLIDFLHDHDLTSLSRRIQGRLM